MQLFNRYVSTRSLTVFAGELLLIFGSVAVAALIQDTPDLPANLWKIALVTVVCQLCLYYNDFYDLTLVHSNRELIVRLLQAGGAASIVLAALYSAPAVDDRQRHLRIGAVRLPDCNPRMAPRVQPDHRLTEARRTCAVCRHRGNGTQSCAADPRSA